MQTMIGRAVARTRRSIGAGRSTVALAAAGVAVAALLTGCGDSSSASDAADAAASPAASVDEVSVHDVWVRSTQDTEDPSMSAAFMVIDNATDADVTLTGASTPVAGMTQLHEMAPSGDADGAMVMQQVDGITITAGRGKVLEPGGLHVMLMNVEDPLAPGDEVELTLEFSDGSTQTLTAPVKEFTEEEDHYHSPGTDEDHDH